MSRRDIVERVAVDGNENDKGWFMVIIKKEKKRRERKEVFHSSISKNEKKSWKMVYGLIFWSL